MIHCRRADNCDQSSRDRRHTEANNGADGDDPGSGRQRQSDHLRHYRAQRVGDAGLLGDDSGGDARRGSGDDRGWRSR
jgi:hypothetical protein